MAAAGRDSGPVEAWLRVVRFLVPTGLVRVVDRQIDLLVGAGTVVLVPVREGSICMYVTSVAMGQETG